jgi:hypothetical protein
VRKLCQMLFAVATVAAFWLAPAKAVWAQAQKPVAVVAIESVDQLFKDIDYLAEAAGQADATMMVKGMAGPFMEGLDKSRPIGAIVTTDGAEFRVVVFVPVTDLDTVLKPLAAILGPPEDAGDGVLKIAGGQAFVKEAGGWAFIAQQPDHLSDLPADPKALLDGMDQKYALAVRGYVQNVPEAFRTMAIGFIKQGMAPVMQRQPGEEEAAAAFRRRMANLQLEQIEMVMKEMDQMTIGWAVDDQAQETYLDVEMTAVPGTKMAEQMAQAAEATSNFAGFVRDEAAVVIHAVSKIGPSDQEQMTGMVQTLRANTAKAIEEEDLGAEGEQAAKDLVNNLFDVLDATVKGGKMNVGAALLLEDKSLFFGAGLQVADGSKIEDGLRKLAELAKDEPDFPGVNFDADTHAGVSFHTMAVPVPEDEAEARAMFGETLNIVIGTSDSAAYFAAGTNAAATLKKIIDDSAQKAAVKMPPMQMVVSLTPIMQFATQFQPDMAPLAVMLEGTDGKDHVTMSQTPIQNGVRMKIGVEEGVLKLIGTAATMFQGGGGPPPGGDDFDPGF